MPEVDHVIVSIRFIGADLDLILLGKILGYSESKAASTSVKTSKSGGNCLVN